MIEAHREILGMGRSGLRNRYCVGEKHYGGDSDYTIYDLARDLLTDGEAWDQDLQVINPDGVPSLRGALSELAAFSLTENAHGFRHGKYQPFQRR